MAISPVAVSMCRGFARLRQDDLFTDILVHVKDRTFRCHKLLLASVSSYFRAEAPSKGSTDSTTEVTIENIRPECFEYILDMVYATGKPFGWLSDEKLLDVVRVMNLLGIKAFIDEIVDYLKSSMCIWNSVDRLLMAKKQNFQKLYAISRDFIVSHFEKIASRNQLQSCDYDSFLDIISDKAIQVDREETVWHVISSWIKFDPSGRGDCMDELLQYCCLTDIDLDCLTETVAFHPAVRASHTASMLVLDAIRFHNDPGSHGYIQLKSRKDRESQKIALLGTDDESDGFMMRMDGQINPDGPSFGYAFCVYWTSIYVTGGAAPFSRSVFEYSGERGLWYKKCWEMPMPLEQHAMVASGDHIYVVGGLSADRLSKEVLQFNMTNHTWKTHGEIVTPVKKASAVCIDQKIYIVGGVTEGDKPVQEIQEYDIFAQCASIVCTLPTPCKFSQSLASHNALFIVTAKGEVIKMDTSTMSIKVVTTVSKFEEIEYFGIAIRDNKLKIYCGALSEWDDWSSGELESITSNEQESDVASIATAEDNCIRRTDEEEILEQCTVKQESCDENQRKEPDEQLDYQCSSPCGEDELDTTSMESQIAGNYDTNEAVPNVSKGEICAKNCKDIPEQAVRCKEKRTTQEDELKVGKDDSCEKSTGTSESPKTQQQISSTEQSSDGSEENKTEGEKSPRDTYLYMQKVDNVDKKETQKRVTLLRQRFECEFQTERRIESTPTTTIATTALTAAGEETSVYTTESHLKVNIPETMTQVNRVNPKGSETEGDGPSPNREADGSKTEVLNVDKMVANSEPCSRNNTDLNSRIETPECITLESAEQMSHPEQNDISQVELNNSNDANASSEKGPSEAGLPESREQDSSLDKSVSSLDDESESSLVHYLNMNIIVDLDTGDVQREEAFNPTFIYGCASVVVDRR